MPTEILSDPLAKLSIRTADQLRARAEELGGAGYMIEGLLPRQSLSLVVGDSGLGKSPLLYQAAICVAAGIPFLGYPTRQGRVLYMDSENGLGQASKLVDGLTSYLGLSQTPSDFRSWNLNDAPEFGEPGNQFDDFVKDFEPSWVIIDPINSIFNEIEKDSTTATKNFQHLRKIMADANCSVTGMHHLRKGSDNPKEKPERLETADLGAWFNRARGSRVLINGSDVRLGVDKAIQDPDSALIVRGFERLNGEIPAIHIHRVRDENGKAKGYERASGVNLLRNPEHRLAYETLPLEFRFTDAKRICGKGDSSTKLFLHACEAANILKKFPSGGYRKVQVGSGKAEPLPQFEAA
jgi:hypothetical protein